MAEQTPKQSPKSAPKPARRDPFWELDPFERWEPLRELGLASPRLSRWMEEAFGGARGGRLSPAVDVSEDDGKYVVTVELPGTKREDVTVEAHENVLTIRGEKRSEREEKKEQSRWVERTYGSFSRSFTLPANADADRVNASFRDGVLTIEIPKSEAAKPKTIAIKG
jgi:HSP20 family protein